MSNDCQESSWGDNPNLLERIQVRQMMIAGDDKIGLPLNGTFKVLSITWIGLQGGKLDRSGNDNGHGSELMRRKSHAGTIDDCLCRMICYCRLNQVSSHLFVLSGNA
jgi:hypothetical protein